MYILYCPLNMLHHCNWRQQLFTNHYTWMVIADRTGFRTRYKQVYRAGEEINRLMQNNLTD
jgi:hypothetical protein